MHFFVLAIMLGTMIVAAMLLVTPILNATRISRHYKGLILLAVIFVGCGAIFGYYNGYGVINGVIDSLLLFVLFAALDWLLLRLRART